MQIYDEVVAPEAVTLEDEILIGAARESGYSGDSDYDDSDDDDGGGCEGLSWR